MLVLLTALRPVLLVDHTTISTSPAHALDAFVDSTAMLKTKDIIRINKDQREVVTRNDPEIVESLSSTSSPAATLAPLLVEDGDVSTLVKGEDPLVLGAVEKAKETTVIPPPLQDSKISLPIRVANSTATLKFCKPCQEITSCLDAMAISSLFSPTEVRDAMAKIATGECSVCHPDNNCTAHLLQLLGFDQLAPRIQKSKTYVTLSSLPHNRKMPLNVAAYQQEEHSQTFTEGPLSIYNPSIIPIPRATKDALKILSGATPTYLASFRVTNVGACNVLPNFDWRQYGVNLVAIAILDEYLEILDDILLDINKHVPHLDANVFEDYRLFDIQGVIYLSHMSLLLPIEVNVTATPLDESATKRLIPSVGNNNHQTTTNIQVFIPAGKRRTIPKIKGAMPGKNFQYFDDLNGTSWIEFWPSPHLVGKLVSNGDVPLVVETNNNMTAFQPPRDSFSAPRFSSTNDRGSACCVKMERHYLPPELQEEYRHLDYLYMGISHTRSKKDKKKIYMSRLYAFVPEFPFELVARSGLFCLGSGSHEMRQPFRDLTLAQQMRLKRTEYDCPNFHYISGMTTSVSGNDVLVAYGVVDCASRIVEISKEEMARALFTNLNTVQRLV